MKKFSVIIPVYNRPAEIKELLETLTRQSDKNFEVIIVEDGSSDSSESIVTSFRDRLDVKYFFKPNSGPGMSRNYGAEKASGDFFIFLDSDCLLPETYFTVLNKEFTQREIHCFGGVDRSHPSFTPVQKAIDFSMTSFLTTGGIRGGKKKTTRFYPRSFNMGFSRKVFEETKGYSGMRFGEDIDLSIRIEKAGYMLELIQDAFVYHKRRTDFKKFYKQIFNSGIARINLFKLYPDSLKLTHFFPVCFVFFVVFSLIFSLFIHFAFIGPLLLYIVLIFINSSIKNKSIEVGALSIVSTITQMFAYGLGFLGAAWQRIVLRKEEFSAFNKNFYK